MNRVAPGEEVMIFFPIAAVCLLGLVWYVYCGLFPEEQEIKTEQKEGGGDAHGNSGGGRVSDSGGGL